MIKIINGDVLSSNADVILHQVNCKGRMGAGLALQIKCKYPHVYKEYAAVCQNAHTSASLLWTVLIVPVSETQSIANLFAQDGYASYGFSHVRMTNYDKLHECLAYINESYRGKKVALPYLLGCGLAGGDWEVVSKIIKDTLADCDVEIFML